jgi:hypothetical protein
VLDAHVRRDAGEEQGVDTVGPEHDLDRRRREGARRDLVEDALVRQRREVVDDLVLALADAVVRRLAERAQLLGEIGVVGYLRPVGAVDAPDVVPAAEVEQPLRVRDDLLGDPRVAILGLV